MSAMGAPASSAAGGGCGRRLRRAAGRDRVVALRGSRLGPGRACRSQNRPPLGKPGARTSRPTRTGRHPSQRRVPKSAEPPALVLTRDYFGVIARRARCSSAALLVLGHRLVRDGHLVAARCRAVIRHRASSPPFIFGSSASRRPSPRKLRRNSVMPSARLGNTISHQ